MVTDEKEIMRNTVDSVQKERRGFLKKTAYAAPTLIAMGTLMKPKSAKADDFGPPPSDPNGDGQGTTWE